MDFQNIVNDLKTHNSFEQNQFNNIFEEKDSNYQKDIILNTEPDQRNLTGSSTLINIDVVSDQKTNTNDHLRLSDHYENRSSQPEDVLSVPEVNDYNES